MTGTTKSGFAYTVNDAEADDWELFDELSLGNSYGEINAAKKLLGTDEQYVKLKDHCRDKGGIVSFKKMDKEIGEILTALLSKNG